MSNFYMTLMSNSSFSVYPDNKSSAFITHLPKCIQLDGEWSMALVELQYPNTFFNIHDGNNTLQFFELNTVRVNVTIPTGYYASIMQLLDTINDITYVKERFQFSFNNEISRVVVTFVRRANSSTCNVSSLNLHPNLAMLLGFEPGIDLFELAILECTVPRVVDGRNEHMLNSKPLVGDVVRCTGKKSPNLLLGIPSQLLVYCDAVEPQIIGDTYARVLRIANVAKAEKVDMTSQLVEFLQPHYMPVERKQFQSIEINIRTDQGNLAPFTFGTTCVKLHYRKL